MDEVKKLSEIMIKYVEAIKQGSELDKGIAIESADAKGFTIDVEGK